jgi:DNA-binding NarL/FixJ family response regulator
LNDGGLSMYEIPRSSRCTSFANGRQINEEITTAKIRIALVHRYPIVLIGLFGIFSSEERYDIVGTGESFAEISPIVHASRPDILLCDLEPNAIDAKDFERISAIGKFTRIIVFVKELSTELAAKALEAGVRGIILKRAVKSQILDAAEMVYNGNLVIPGQNANKLVKTLRVNRNGRMAGDVRAPLTNREKEILNRLCRAETNREIAESISISEKTVKRCISSLMQKLNARNRVELAIRASARISRGS